MKKINLSFIVLISFCLFQVTNVSAQIWQIGYGTMTFTDPARNNRVINANIFYPADVSGTNVPLGSPVTQRYPVIVFGHDEGTAYQNYQYLWDWWTIKGFVVVVPTTEMTVPMDVEEFAHDLAFIAEHFKALRYDPTSMFYNRHNSKSCVIGHGMGGSAAVLAATYYPAVNTMITLSANESVPSAISAATQVTAPSVVVAAGQDCVSPVGTTQEALFNNIASDCKAFINFTAASRCYFAQNAGYCTVNDNPCAPVSAAWQSTALDVTWYLVSFMRYYLKSNAPALDKFEWKLQQKDKDLSWIITCNQNSPRIGWQPEDAGVDVEDINPYLKFSLYPNPVSSGGNVNLVLESGYDDKATISVSNMMGQLVFSEEVSITKNTYEFSFPSNSISKGNYIVMVTSRNGRTTMPLIIQ